MQEKARVPAIRFAGFTDAWEQRKLGETLYSLQNNTLSRAELSLESGIAKDVHYGDILVKFGEVLDVEKELLPMITDESEQSTEAHFCKMGTLLLPTQLRMKQSENAVK